MNINHNININNINDMNIDNPLYHPVQQIEWENDIIWNYNNRNSISNQSILNINNDKIILKCPMNKELLNDSWLQSIKWDKNDMIPEGKLIFDLNDTNILYYNNELQDIRPTLRVPIRKLGAAEQRREQLDKQKIEKKKRIQEAMINLDFGDETAERRVGNTDKNNNIAISNKKSKNNNNNNKDINDKSLIMIDTNTNIGFIHHSIPSIKLSFSKPELTKNKLRHIHRPQGKFKIQEILKLMIIPNKNNKLNIQNNHNINQNSNQNNLMITQVKKPSDLYPINRGKIILIEYIEENPPILPDPGMASRIQHYWRPPENTVLNNNKNIIIPERKYGKIITLGENDDSPFIGDVPSGRIVTGFISKMYKIPLFKHNPSLLRHDKNKNRNLFLLFRLPAKANKKQKNKIIFNMKTVNNNNNNNLYDLASSQIYITEIPDLYVAGQVEPQMDVPAPNSRNANDFIKPYMSFHILKLFKKTTDGERLKIEDISRAFPTQSGTSIRKRMKEIATFERGGNDSGWWKIKPSHELMTEDDLRSNITPESVCLYQSMMAGHRKLIDIGLSKLVSPGFIASAIHLLIKRLENRKNSILRAVMYNMVAIENDMNNNNINIDSLSTVKKKYATSIAENLWKDDFIIKNLEKDIQIGRYIEEQLQCTPWNLTNNYVECHLQGKGSGMLRLGGVGDPSGRGEGFSFVRVPQSRSMTKKNKDGSLGLMFSEDYLFSSVNVNGLMESLDQSEGAVQKAVASVTGTTADLRKLKMKEAGDVLRNLGMADSDIKKLRRWDRIHMVRDLSSRASAHGVAGSLAKFARGARKSLSSQQQEYRRKCDVIYERQMDVLSSDNIVFSSDEEDEEDDDLFDLDELEKDLENDMLGSTKGNKSNHNNINNGPKNLFTKGGGGLNRSKAALAEREDAAELRRLMQEMKEHEENINFTKKNNHILINKLINKDSIKSNQSNNTINIMKSNESLTSAKSNINEENNIKKQDINKNNKIVNNKIREAVKRTTRIIGPDGVETVRIEFLVDEKLVLKYKTMKERKDKMKNNAMKYYNNTRDNNIIKSGNNNDKSNDNDDDKYKEKDRDTDNNKDKSMHIETNKNININVHNNNNNDNIDNAINYNKQYNEPSIRTTINTINGNQSDKTKKFKNKHKNKNNDISNDMSHPTTNNMNINTSIKQKKKKKNLTIKEQIAELAATKKRKQLQDQLKKLQRTEEQNRAYQEMLKNNKNIINDNNSNNTNTQIKDNISNTNSTIKCTKCGQIGHIRTNRNCPLYLSDDIILNKNDSILYNNEYNLNVSMDNNEKLPPITINLTQMKEEVQRHHIQEKKRKIQEAKEQAEIYKKPYNNIIHTNLSTNSNVNHNKNIIKSRFRMSKEELNIILNKILIKLNNIPESLLFRLPVDKNIVKDYYNIIKQPMDLFTIKNKNDKYEYENIREFIKDLELIVQNSKIYNGDATKSIITKNAMLLLEISKKELMEIHSDGNTNKKVILNKDNNKNILNQTNVE